MTTPYEPMSPVADWIMSAWSAGPPMFDYPTSQAEDIIERLVPAWAEAFLRANAKYRRVDNHLGPAGVFPDINRKVGRLERDVWDAEPLPAGAEPTREVVSDLIGHLFLLWHMLDEQKPTDAEMMTMIRDMDGYAVAYAESADPAPVVVPAEVFDVLRRTMHGQPIPHSDFLRVNQFLAEHDPGSAEVRTFDQDAAPPEPLADWIVEKDGKLRALSDRAMSLVDRSTIEGEGSSGWDDLPDELQRAIVMIANGHEVVSSPELRQEASQYLSEHGHDGG